jgi:hypothetical protein
MAKFRLDLVRFSESTGGQMDKGDTEPTDDYMLFHGNGNAD